MIGTIRKHSKWLWLVIATLTIISFIYWGAGPSRLGGGGGGGGRAPGDYGTIYGHKVTERAYRDAQTGFILFYFFRTRGEQWPDRNPNITEAVLQRETYVRLMLMQKARDLGIHVSEDAVVAAADDLLRSLSPDGRAVPAVEFARQVLQPRGLTLQDLENFARQYLMIEQLQQAIGLTGELITPQEAAIAYQRDHQELSAQIVFFSASNYLAQVAVSPAGLSQFFSNHLAAYHIPERVQVSYVTFELSNYFAAAEQKLGRTNLDNQVNSTYLQYGIKSVPGAKTPEEAKAKIRDALIRQQAIKEVRLAANDFAQEVFNRQPLKPENLAAVAQAKGLAARTTAPFAANTGPEEFTAPASFVRAAFGLTPDEPLAGPVPGTEALYVLALIKQLPAEIPTLDQIRDRVIRDFKWNEAVLLARKAGTNLAHGLAGLTPDHGFTAVCVAAGFQPQLLPPFSLSTRQLPELDDHAELNQVKQAAFSTPPGKASGLVETADGAFVLYVQSRLPVDQAKMNSELTQYAAELGRERMSEVFNEWVNLEANRQLFNTPVYKQAYPSGAVR